MVRRHVQQAQIILVRSRPVQVVHGERNPVVQEIIHVRTVRHADPV